MDYTDISLSVTQAFQGDGADLIPVYWELRNSAHGYQIIDSVWDPKIEQFTHPLYQGQTIYDHEIKSGLLDHGASDELSDYITEVVRDRNLCAKSTEEV